MMIGERLLLLRKEKNLSQEEVAEKLSVTRQTISKWETDASTPDLDKLAPLCELYGITADELLTGTKKENEKRKEEIMDDKTKGNQKKAVGISLGVFIYFIAVAWIMITIPVMDMNPVLSSAIFLVICGIATYIIVYTNLVYGNKKKESDEKKEEPVVLKQIKTILYMVTLLIYLYLSFVTMAWHITWILWVVASLIEEIIKLFFMLGGKNNEK